MKLKLPLSPISEVLFWLTALTIIPFSHFIFIRQLQYGLDVGFVICVAAAIASWKRRIRLEKNPVILEAYAHGFWFVDEKFFVPYERLYQMTLVAVYLPKQLSRKPFGFNFCFEVIALPSEQAIVLDSWWRLFWHKFLLGKNLISFQLKFISKQWEKDPDALFKEFGLIASKHNVSSNYPPPVFVYDVPDDCFPVVEQEQE